MKQIEASKILNDLKIGRGKDLRIKIPGPSGGKSDSSPRTYEISGSRILSVFEKLDTDNKKGIKHLEGMVVFGSAVCASHQMIRHKYLCGLIQLKRKHLIYDKGRRPNDVDMMIIISEDFADQVESTEEEIFPTFISSDIKASYYCSDGYSGKYSTEEVREKELDIIFITKKQLVEKFEEGDRLVNHIETAGVLVLGECPIKLKGPAFFSANKKTLSLTFPTI